jgi:hypothetical protein
VRQPRDNPTNRVRGVNGGTSEGTTGTQSDCGPALAFSGVIEAPATTAPTALVARRDAVLLGAFALGLRIPALLASRELNPDDGYYGMSVVAMRGGGIPYREVFSSQGPLHLPLLYLGDLLGLRTMNAPRVTPIAAGVVATVVTYFIGRRIASRQGAVLAALVVAVSGSVLWVTGPVTSDGPTLALVACAFLAALRYRERPSLGRLVTVSLLLAGALLVKPAIAALGGIAVVIIVVPARRVRDLVIAAATMVAAALVVSAPFGLGNVWRQTVSYQLSSQREQSVGANVVKLATTLFDRDKLLLVLAALALVVFLTDTGARRLTLLPPTRAVRAVLVLWVVITAVFLVLQPALWRNHVASLVVPIALLIAMHVPPPRWLAVALIVVVPWHVVSVSGILHPEPPRGPTAQAIAALRSLPPGAWVISDEPGIVWRAGRRTTDDYVDTSVKRQEQGQITAATIARAAAQPQVCGVLVWSASHWGAFDDLAERLAAVGYQPVFRFTPEHTRVLYEKMNCKGTLS